MRPAPPIPHLTVKEAAAHIKTSEKFLYDFIASGNGPPTVRLGSMIRIPFDSFIRWSEKTPNGQKPHKRGKHTNHHRPGSVEKEKRRA